MKTLRLRVSASPAEDQSMCACLTADAVAELVHAQFGRLPKTGKPAPNEWTVVAGIVAVPTAADGDCGTKPVVLALGTGTKCVGGDVAYDGRRVHDSHAEVVTRRSFVRFLYAEMLRLVSGGASPYMALQAPSSAASSSSGGEADPVFQWSSRWSLHLYVSQCPCGDACIVPKHAAATVGGASADKGDVERTGAKPLPNGPQDTHQTGASYHERGLLRTKPGRGLTCASLSCSDKIARWNVLGLQGSLISKVCSPIYLSRIIIGGTVYNQAIATQALCGRVQGVVDLPHGYV